MASLAHILNGDVGLSVRTKLNSLIDQYNVPAGFPSGGGTPGSVLFLDASGNMTQDNAHFFWDDSADNLKLLGSLTTLAAVFDGATSGSVTVEAQAVAGSWTMKLPATSGTNLYVLQTDGTGITSWVPQSGGGGGGMAIGGSVTGATAGSVLFTGAGVLAQDNANFFWDDTSKFLKIGTPGTLAAYYLNGVPAIYEVPNASGNNWFEGNAGNTTLSGYGNFGTGDGVMAGITTGVSNVGIGAIGSYTGKTTFQNLTTGTNNMAVGAGALGQITSDIQNTAVGNSAVGYLGVSGSVGNNNVGIGSASLAYLGLFGIGGDANIAIGQACGSGLTSGSHNLFIGQNCFGNSGSNSTGNVVIGDSAFINFNGTAFDNNLILGAFRGPAIASLQNVIILCGGNDNNNDNVNALDCGYTTPGLTTWSFNTRFNNNPVGLHIYNTSDYSARPATNYERAVLDWNITSNVFRLGSQASGTGTVRLIAIDAFQKAGSPAAGDLPSGTWGVINDTSGGNTWLVYNNAGTIRKVQLV